MRPAKYKGDYFCIEIEPELPEAPLTGRIKLSFMRPDIYFMFHYHAPFKPRHLSNYHTVTYLEREAALKEISSQFLTHIKRELEKLFPEVLAGEGENFRDEIGGKKVKI